MFLRLQQRLRLSIRSPADEQADEGEAKPVGLDLQPHVMFEVQSATSWSDNDLTKNRISKTETEPDYITRLNEKLLQKRFFTDTEAEAVGTLGFACLSLMNLPVAMFEAPF